MLLLTLWNLLLFFIRIYSCKWFSTPNSISCCQIWLWMCRKWFISTCFRVTLALKLLRIAVICCRLLFRLFGLLWFIFILLEALVLLVDLLLLCFVPVSAALQLLHLLVQQLRKIGLRSLVTVLLLLVAGRWELALRILFSITLWIHTFWNFEYISIDFKSKLNKVRKFIFHF